MMPTVDRRRFCAGLLLAGLSRRAGAQAGPGSTELANGMNHAEANAVASPAAQPVANAPITVTDMAGRRVTLPAPPRRIVLLEANDILTLAAVHPDPAALVVGWAAVDRIDSGLLQQAFERHGTIPVVGGQTPDTLSYERILQLAPDLVVASPYMLPTGVHDSLAPLLAQAGIALVFSDTPSSATAQSLGGPRAGLQQQLQLWGGLLGLPERAAALGTFLDSRLDAVAHCLGDAAPVTTYLEVQSSVDDCCWAAGQQVWGELLALAGGRLLPAVTAPWFQQLPLETLLSTPHDVYIASGGSWAAGGRPAIGPGLDPAQGRAGLQRLIARPGFANVPSVRQQRVHGIWTGLISVRVLQVLFVEQAALWLHPQRCAALNPAATLQTLNQDFLAVPIPGPLWASL